MTFLSAVCMTLCFVWKSVMRFVLSGNLVCKVSYLSSSKRRAGLDNGKLKFNVVVVLKLKHTGECEPSCHHIPRIAVLSSNSSI